LTAKNNIIFIACDTTSLPKIKKIIKLNHESFARALYSDGALTAAKWLINKKPGLYSMRDLLNFK